MPHQIIEPETLMPDTMRVLYPATIGPGKYSTISIARNPNGKVAPLRGIAPDFTLRTKSDCTGQLLVADGPSCPLPELRLIEDKSDTWSHFIDRFAGPQIDHAHWSQPELI